MTNAKMVEDYLMWKRDKDLYPPKFSPDEWAKEILMSEASARLNMIKDLLESDPGLEPTEFAVHVCRIVYDPLEELMNDRLPVGASGETQSVGQEEG